MTDRSIVVRLRADTSDYTGNITKAASQTDKAAQSMSGWVTKNSQAISTVSTSVGIVGAAMTGVAVLAVSKFAQFDAAMSNVAATGDDARGSLDALRQAALDAGASTVFSATEAANAVENLAKAGVSAEDILGGGLAGSLDLAAAGSLDVAQAAEIAATAMTQFSLEGEDMTHVADLLAAGAGKAQGDVTDMAAALKQSGLVAAQFGLDIEETVGTLTAFASAGLLGSDAGTSFRTMLLRLGNPSKESAKLMEELGIAAYDANGEFVGMAGVAEQLKTKLEGKTDAERDSALATIFGSDAIRAANVLMKEGAAGINEWTNKVDDQGYAAEVAATKLDNLQGDLEKLSGAFETALIGLGEGGDSPLRALVQGATEAVDAFGEMPKEAQSATLALVGGGGLVLLGIAGLGKLVVAINEVRVALAAMQGSRVASVAGSLGMIAGYAVGIGATAAATGMLVTELTGGDVALKANELESAVRRLSTSGDLSDINAQFQNFGDFLGIGISDVNSFGDAMNEVLNEDLNHKATRAFEWIPGVQSNIEVVEERFASLDSTMSQMVAEGNADEAAKAFAAMSDEFVNNGHTVGDLIGLLPDYWDSLEGVRNEALDTAKAEAELEAATAETTTEVVDQTEALHDLVEAQSEAAGNAMSLYDAQTNLEAAYDSAEASLKENGATLDITTEKGRANRDALAGIASAGWDVVDSMAETGATQEEMQGTLTSTRDHFLQVAGAMGMGSDEANALADEMGLIPTNIQPVVNVTTSGVAEAQAAVDTLVARNNQRIIRLFLKPEVAEVGRGTVLAPGLADGGPITGPGGPRSDTVPILASPGEWVISAAAVDHYGPGFMAKVNARRYADGGEVSAWSGSPSTAGAQAAAPVAVVTMDGARLTGSLDLGNGLVGVIDARVAQGLAVASRSRDNTRATVGRVR